MESSVVNNYPLYQKIEIHKPYKEGDPIEPSKPVRKERTFDITLTGEDLVLLDYLIDSEIQKYHKEFYLVGFGNNYPVVNSLHKLYTDIINRLYELKGKLK